MVPNSLRKSFQGYRIFISSRAEKEFIIVSFLKKKLYKREIRAYNQEDACLKITQTRGIFKAIMVSAFWVRYYRQFVRQTWSLKDGVEKWESDTSLETGESGVIVHELQKKQSYHKERESARKIERARTTLFRESGGRLGWLLTWGQNGD